VIDRRTGTPVYRLPNLIIVQGCYPKLLSNLAVGRACGILVIVEFAEVVRRRRMVRSFSDEPVEPTVVERILDAARRGPTAGYSQGVEFVVVTDPDTRSVIAEPAEAILARSGHKNFIGQAPVHIVICCNPEIYKARYREPDKQQAITASNISEEMLWSIPYWHTDAGCALMLMLLAAVNEGIAAAFVGPDEHIRSVLDIPNDYIPIGIVLLGHEAPDARTYGDVSASPRPRRPLNDIVHRERWG
jgi:nitroreductase